MFNRKQTDDPGQGPNAAQGRPSVTEPARLGNALRVEATRRMPDLPAHSDQRTRSSPPAESKKLIVGPDISLHGHIAACDRLVVEGTVEAELTDCHTIEIAETGVFIGAAEIEAAVVSGRYEGSLTVRGHLLIRGAGSVTGTVRYGRIEIQPGGAINGDVKSLASANVNLGLSIVDGEHSLVVAPTPTVAAAGSR